MSARGHGELMRYLGALPDKGPAHITRLTARHKQIILLHLEGMPLKSIADELGVSPATVSRVLRSDEARRVVNNYLSFADQEFKVLYKMAIDAVRDALSPNQEIDVRLKAADRYLRAHGKYGEQGGAGSQTAEDVIKRIMEIKLTEVVSSGAQPQEAGPPRDAIPGQGEEK